MKRASVGRPREHGEATAAALLEAAERVIAAGGIEAVSVRGLADEVGTTTRAVYALFGSKDGVFVALAARAWETLRESLRTLPVTGDPRADLVAAGSRVFRRFVLTHPVLFRIGVQRSTVTPDVAGQYEAARLRALEALEGRISRLREAGGLAGRSVREAACHFHALCEGLADLELRGALPEGQEQRIWADALHALVTGLGIAVRTPIDSHSSSETSVY